MSRLEEIADGVYRLGTDWVNWYLCDSDGALTVIDCGFRDPSGNSLRLTEVRDLAPSG